jgi:murein L,D-transpeptidase YafK
MSVAASVSLVAWANLDDVPLPSGSVADRLVLEKSKRALTLYRQAQVVKRYRVALGREPVGPKAEEGDRRTPEGRFTIDSRKADSSHFRALHISYPGPAHLAAARARGVEPGGAVMIHGLRNGLGWLGRMHRLADWTLGCVAVTNPEMLELWEAVPNGTPIEIIP